MLPLQLNILSLNVWGIPFVSRDRKKRIAAIATELSTGKYDLVSLQEVWSNADCELLKSRTKSVLSYSHYFYSGVSGAGLLVLSKYPILSTLFHSWSVNGYFHRIQHADWFGGKGVGLCRIFIDENIILHFYNTHLHAEYDNVNDEYKTHRAIQAFDTAQFIRATSAGAAMQVLAGDLNAQAHDICYKTLLYISGMQDSCNNPELITNCRPQNSYTSRRDQAIHPKGVRIDHIFISSAANISTIIIDFRQPLTPSEAVSKFSYSDHEAILLQIRLEECSSELAKLNCIHDKSEENIARSVALLHETIDLCENSLKKLKISRIYYYTITFIMCLVLCGLSEYSNVYQMIFILLRFCALTVLIFSLFMASIWNFMEHNGILAEQKSMEILISSLKNGFS